MADFSFDAALRWARLDPQRTLARRSDDLLPFVESGRTVGSALLLDTCVYIDQMQDRISETVRTLIEQRRLHHSTVAIQELMHTVGVLDPRDPRTPAVNAPIRRAIQSIHRHRIVTPDADTLGKAGLLSGVLCRIQGYGGDLRFRAFQDCMLFLQAQKYGLTVLTANIADYDCLLQLIPTGRVLLYRTK